MPERQTGRARIGRPRSDRSGLGLDLADELRSSRSSLGLAREDLAHRAEVSPNTLAAIEQGKVADPGFFTVAAFARAMSMSLDSLMAAIQRRAGVRHEHPSFGLISVGYEGQTLGEFVDRLRSAGVDTVADVRLTPLSRRPGFSKRKLTAALADAGIEYVHLKELGNPKDNRDAFRGEAVEQGRRRFRSLLANAEARVAITTLANRARHEVVAVLCFERDERHCHRDVVIEEVRRASRALPATSLS